MNERSEQARTRTVLVVDSYTPGRVAISAVIAELGHRVLEAATAAEGRAIVERATIDAIVADADDADIRSFIDELQRRGRAIPTVMLTTRQPSVASMPNTTILQKPTGVDALSGALASSLAPRAFPAAVARGMPTDWDVVDEASYESFPASDPPGWGSSHASTQPIEEPR